MTKRSVLTFTILKVLIVSGAEYERSLNSLLANAGDKKELITRIVEALK